MASPAVTYTFTNSTVADADEVNTNFADIINSLTDGTKDLSISALTAAGSATLNGNVTLGNASSDDITVTGSLSSSIPIKTTNSYNIGSATLGLAGVYFGTNDTDTVRVVAAGTMAASRTYTLPDAGADAYLVMSEGATTINGALTLGSTLSVTSNTTLSGRINNYSGQDTFSTTPVTLIDLSTVDDGIYVFVLHQVNASSDKYLGLVCHTGTTYTVTDCGVAGVTISISGSNLRAQRNAGGNVSHKWALIRIY